MIHPYIYQQSHKPHHFITNPRLFDAFNGSVTDTVCMILIPLLICAGIVPANVWSYMTFGSLYANWLCLIHSEYHHVWTACSMQSDSELRQTIMCITNCSYSTMATCSCKSLVIYAPMSVVFDVITALLLLTINTCLSAPDETK